MLSRKPRIVIIGAGMAGLSAATKLHKSPNLDISIVEGGNRIGGRINTSFFSGNRIEQGATWIHGIEGSPVYELALESNSLRSIDDHPSELMHGYPADNPVFVAEGGLELKRTLVEPVSTVFNNLLKIINCTEDVDHEVMTSKINVSFGSFLRQGLQAYWDTHDGTKDEKLEDEVMIGNWSKRSLEEAIFAMHENMQRSISSADDLCDLDCNGLSEYNRNLFPGEDITIRKGYSSVIEFLASGLPDGSIQLGKKVEKIEWQLSDVLEEMDDQRPVKLHFNDGSVMLADHVVVTVSLGVLKHGIGENHPGLFDPPLPESKIGAISRLGFGVVNKVFLQQQQYDDNNDSIKFPLLKSVFRKPDSEFKDPNIPDWIRKMNVFYPIYENSEVLLSWFAGKEALEVESLSEEEIINGFSNTISNLISGNDKLGGKEVKFEKVLRTKWGSDPLFFGSYSYVAVGSSGDDMDTLAEPLPGGNGNSGTSLVPRPLQIMFAGEATHRGQYSNTHGAYFSGIREADRLLKHYNCTID